MRIKAVASMGGGSPGGGCGMDMLRAPSDWADWLPVSRVAHITGKSQWQTTKNFDTGT
jgi:hypothetical protein